MVDLLLRNATIYPGDAEPRPGDVAIDNGVMVAVGPGLQHEAARTIDLGGLCLAPGFVDMHAHSALRTFEDPILTPKLLQGFTTELINPDGMGPAPVTDKGLADRMTQLALSEGRGPAEWPWRSIGQYLDALDGTRPAITLCPFVPHGAVRDAVLGGAQRAPGADELRAMRRQVARGMEAGAWGISFGLVYTPGAYANRDEVVAVATEAGRFGGLISVHMRGESHNLLEAVEEMIDVSRRSGAPLHLSHLKVLGHRNAWKLEPLLEMIDRAPADGVDVTFDQYPYGAGVTLLSALLPPWAHDGGVNQMTARLRDRPTVDRLLQALGDPDAGPESFYYQCGPEGIVVIDCGLDGPGDAMGRTLAEIASARGVEPERVVIDLLLETGMSALVILHYADESVVKAIARHPAMLVGSDAVFAATPHPRLWGTAPRFLGGYAIRDGVVTVREAIARLSFRAARRVGLDDRGEIAPGQRADLVAFDPDRVIDRATYDQPELSPSGIDWVIVGGAVAVDPGGPTRARRGQIARKQR
ncbi:MAG: D-aminoacylase [bacterium]|nr:D-aminoacylase [bacterium]